MKLSLAWICDHLDGKFAVDIQTIVNRFNESVAEIESFHKVTVEKKKFALAEVKESTASGIKAALPNGSVHELSGRTDLSVGQHALVIQEKSYRWVKLADLGSSKDGLLGPIEPSTFSQSFESIPEEDWVIDVDNKSINHRPDLWSHRGVARELSVLFGVQLKKIDALIEKQKIQELSNEVSSKQTGAIVLKESKLCSRFACAALDTVNYSASDVGIAARLVRVDAKPINATVDLTNYVMFDIGQPMHAYNTTKSKIEQFEVRLAQNKEKMTLLDGQSIELVPQDLVVTDGKQPIALAGVMGGQSLMVDKNAHSVMIEAAHFDPAAVRLSGARHKLRTDASARFEKSLDPYNVTDAIERYLALAQRTKLVPFSSYAVVARGQLPKQTFLTISHHLIEERVGAPIESSFIVKTLTALGFSVETRDGSYHIGVPSFRATKDIKIAEDIIEEVVRIYGFAKIPTRLQSRLMDPFPLHAPLILRQIKRLLAFGHGMREVYNYALYDTDFVTKLGLTDFMQQPHVLSPVSENWKYLVKSLIPGLLKYVAHAAPDHDELRFFESGRTWYMPSDRTINENKSLSGIFYKRHEAVDFYECEAIIDKLSHSFGFTYEWKQMSEPTVPWYARYTSAQLLYNGRVVGMAGLVDASFFAKVAQGYAFVFELDLSFMIDFNKPVTQLKPISKFQKSTRDISFLVDQKVTVQELLRSIAAVEPRIESMHVVDLFSKPEWKDKKSITLRMVISDHTKTLSKDEVEQIYNSVVTRLGSYEIQIR